MANIKSQIKRNRQNERRRLRNRGFRGTARAAVKNARTEMENGNEAQSSVLAAISALDKAAQKGAIHSRNAARRKGRLMKQLAMLGGSLKPARTEPAPSEGTAKSEGAAKKEVKEAKPKKATKKSTAKKKTTRKSTAKKKKTTKKSS